MTTHDVQAELGRAAALIDLGRYQEAGERAERLLAIDPDNPDAASVLAQAALGLRDHSRAFEAARTAASLAPPWWWPHHLMSIACSRLGDGAQAIDRALEAVRLAPGEYLAHLRLAESLLDARRTTEARGHVVRACELAPHAVGPRYVAGRVAIAEGRRDDAARAYQEALSIDPDHAPSHNELARLRLGQGLGGGFRASALADAAGGFATAVRANPENETVRRNLDMVAVAFLRITAYFVFLAAFFGFRIASASTSGLAKNLPLILLALPVLYAARFIARLRPQLRRFLIDLVIHRSAVRIPMVLLAGSAVLIVAEVLNTGTLRVTLGSGAVVLAMISRILLWRHQGHIRGGRRPGWLATKRARGSRRGHPLDRSRAEQPPIPYTGRALGRRRLTRVIVLLVVATAIVGIWGAHRGNAGIPIPGIPGYATLDGPTSYPLPAGRPWGNACRPIRLAIEPPAPDWIYAQTNRAVTQARGQGIDVTLADRDLSWSPTSLYYRDGQTSATAVTVPVNVNDGTPPSGEHITIEWSATADPDGHNEDLTLVEATVWARAVANSPKLVQRSIRQLIALTQGIFRTSNPDSGINDTSSAGRFTSTDIKAMLSMSGCASPGSRESTA